MKKTITILLLVATLVTFNINILDTLASENAIVDDNVTTDNVFSDFPVEIDKLVEDESHLTLIFTYMKPINENDETLLTLTDSSASCVDFEFIFVQDQNTAVFRNVEIGKIYKAIMDETIEGISTVYAGTLSTKAVKADFPEIEFSGAENLPGTSIPVENILYRDTEEYATDKTVILNENLVLPKDERGRPVAKYEETYLPEELEQNPILRATAESNIFMETMRGAEKKIYEVQTTAEREGVITHYRAFYSTEDQTFFEPGFTFENSKNPPHAIIEPLYSDFGDTLLPDAFDGAYDMYIEEQYTTLGYSSAIKFKFSVLEDASYTFETTGNLDTQISYYSKNANEEFVRSQIYYGGGTGGNARFTTSLAAGQERFFIVELESGTGGNLTIKVSNNDWPNDGNYFSNPTPLTLNAEHNDSLDYGADVDSFSFRASHTETYKFQMNYNSTDLRINPYQVMTSSVGLPYWSMPSILYLENYDPHEYPDPVTNNVPVQSNTDYILIIRNPDRSGDSTNYSLTIKNSFMPDDYEPNNSYGTAHELNPNGEEFTSGFKNDPTLHRGDTDYFKFTLSDTRKVTINITPPNNDEYYVFLDYEDETGYIDEIAMAEINTHPEIEEELDAGIYYIVIFRDGLATDYQAPYTMSWVVENITSPGQIVEVDGIEIVEPILGAWDWAACAEMVGKLRNYNEGGAPITKDYINAIENIMPNLDGDRGTIAQTATATRYIYSDGDVSGTKFLPADNPLYTEDDFAALVESNKATIILLSDPNDPYDMTIARYVIVSGVNTTNHQLKIINPITGQSNWYATDLILNGGYLLGSNIKYTYHVMERL